MDGRSYVSPPLHISGLPDRSHTPMPYPRDLSTGALLADNSPPPPHSLKIERSTADNADAEWMAELGRIPMHDPLHNNLTEKYALLNPRFFSHSQAAVSTNQEPLSILPSEDLIVNPSLPSPSLEDPWFTEWVENTVLAPNSISPVQNDLSVSNLIGNVSTGRPEGSLSHSLSGTSLNSWRHSVS